MPAIAASSIFPSLKYIATDASGNLDEVESIDAVQASKTVGGITFKAKDAGVAGNSITVELVEVLGASADAVTVSGSDISIALKKVDGLQARKTVGGVTFKAVNAGTAGNSITVQMTDSSSSGSDAITVSGSDILIDLTDAASASSTLDIKNLVAGDSSAAALVVVNGADSSTLAQTFGSTSLAEGVDAIVAADSSTLDIKNLVDSDSSAAALVAVSGTSASTPAQTFSQTNLDDVIGVDAVLGELEPNENYLMLKQSDLYDVADSEQADGRKLVWGFVSKATEAFEAMASQPANLTLRKSTPSSTDAGTALKQTYSMVAKYAVSGLDLKDEA